MGRHEQHDARTGQKTARTREATHCALSSRVAGEAVFFELCDEDTAGWQSLPALHSRSLPQERVQWHMVQISLPRSLPWCRSSFWVGCKTESCSKLEDQAFVDVTEQMIAVPKISSPVRPLLRTVLPATQLLEQLVGSASASSRSVLARGRDTAGIGWCQVAAWPGGLLVDDGAHATSSGTPPRGIHRQPRAEHKHWARKTNGRPCEEAARVPAVLRDRRDATGSLTDCQNSSCEAEMGTHSANCEENRRGSTVCCSRGYAPAAFVSEAQGALSEDGTGAGPPPQRAAGEGAKRWSGAREERWPTGTEASTPREAPCPNGTRGAGEGQSRPVTWLPQGLSSPHRC